MTAAESGNLKESVKKALLGAPLWYLGTCRGNVPNVVPVGFKWIEGDRLLVTDLFLGKTRENIRSNAQVAVTVAAFRPKRGFQIKGTAQALAQGAEFARVKEFLAREGLGEKLVAVISITPRHLYLLDPGDSAGRELSLCGDPDEISFS
jgi:predicted pyridoxine 5'-phosphate oxidase superfamily flavin-nucleotide-binding protein